MPRKLKLIVSSFDFEDTRKLSAAKLISHLQEPASWPEASIHDPSHQFPFMDIEFHGRAGFSILCFDIPSSRGYLAATTTARLSKPSVLVCLGGQVIEKWPKELFLPSPQAKSVISGFLKTGQRHPEVKWVRLDRFKRETVHPGGKGLIHLWDELRKSPTFPVA